MHKINSLRVQDISRNKRDITRREFLKGSTTLGIAGATAYGAKKAWDFGEEILYPEENFAFLKVDGNFYVGNFKFRNKFVYVEFDGDIYLLQPLTATHEDKSPLGMIHRKHDEINQVIDSYTALRASDLFNVVNNNKDALEKLVTNEIKSSASRIPATPKIIPGQSYRVPVKTVYASLDDVIFTYKRQQ